MIYDNAFYDMMIDGLEGFLALLLEPNAAAIARFLLLAVREKIDRDLTGGWISVKDRLPEDGAFVLAIVSGRPHDNTTLIDAYELANYDVPDGWFVEEYPAWDTPEVSHWMPLPKLPGEC